MPAYPFGAGLGYTTYEIESITAPEVVGAGEDLIVDAVATNTGGREGKVVVQVYAERTSESSIDAPQRWLAGFATATLAVGERRTLPIAVPWRRLAHWTGAWQVEPGTFRLVRIAHERCAWGCRDGSRRVSGCCRPMTDASPDARNV